MSKPVFDLEKFWNAPRGVGKLVDDGKYCAFGSAYHALGYSDEKILGLEIGFSADILGYFNFDHSDPNYKKVQSIWQTNDRGGPTGYKGTFVPNPEKANRMMLDYIQENDLVEFVNVTYVPGDLAKVKEYAVS